MRSEGGTGPARGRGDGGGPEGGEEGEAVGERGGGVWGLGGRERKKRKTGTDEGRGHGWRRDLMRRRDGNEGEGRMRDQGPGTWTTRAPGVVDGTRWLVRVGSVVQG